MLFMIQTPNILNHPQLVNQYYTLKFFWVSKLIKTYKCDAFIIHTYQYATYYKIFSNTILKKYTFASKLVFIAVIRYLICVYGFSKPVATYWLLHIHTNLNDKENALTNYSFLTTYIDSPYWSQSNYWYFRQISYSVRMFGGFKLHIIILIGQIPILTTLWSDNRRHGIHYYKSQWY